MSDGTERCTDMLEAMLVADPGSLRGTGDSSLAIHVRDCTSCAAAAARILDAQSELVEAISLLSASHDASRIVLPRRRRTMTFAVPLAAAATLMFVLWPRPGSDGPAQLAPPAQRITPVTNVPAVNVARGDDVAIMRTSNPNITVVWYMKQESQ